MNTPVVGGQPPGRNEPCPCKSGLKFKKCHGDPVKQQTCMAAAREAATNMMVKLIYEEVTKNGKDSAVCKDQERGVLSNAGCKIPVAED